MAKRRIKPVGARHALPLQQEPDKQPRRRADAPIWQCPNCGQNYFGAHPPDMCDYCQDFTTWQPVKPDDQP
jgi:hypothetical protein